MIKKTLFLLLSVFALSGCLEQEIYTEIRELRFISHPPKTLRIIDLKGRLQSNFRNDPTSPISMEVYIHRAECDNVQSKSLGADFDGYIRITLSETNRTIARAQMDYKGEATHDDVQQVHDYLMHQLQW